MRYPADSLRARLSRLASPRYSACLRCGMSWRFATPHHTSYAEGRSCFPLCERCWSSFEAGGERLRYYRQMFDGWSSSGDVSLWRKIQHAVLHEGRS